MTGEDNTDRVKAVVWLADKTCRYQPKAIGNGPGWAVWDMMENRRVTPREMRTMTFEQATELLKDQGQRQGEGR